MTAMTSSDASSTTPTTGTGPRRRGPVMTTLALVGLGVIAVDTISKVIVVATLEPGRPVRWLGGFIYLTLSRNSGAAFSMATDYTWLLTLLAIVVAVGIVVYSWYRLRSMPWAVALGLIAGGALGNLVDRLFRTPGFLHGEVVDFISFLDPYGRGFAIFNLADSALCIGVALVVLLEIRGRRIDGTVVTRNERDDSSDS